MGCGTAIYRRHKSRSPKGRLTVIILPQNALCLLASLAGVRSASVARRSAAFRRQYGPGRQLMASTSKGG